MKQSRNRLSSAGFSLIELSILLMVLALATTATLSWLAPSAIDEANRVEITKKRLYTIRNALYAFRVKYDRLPCAADRTLNSVASSEVGQEDCTGVGTVNIGVVPTRTLGIHRDNMEDGWGRRFTYVVANSICALGTVAPVSAPLNCDAVSYRDNDGNLTVRTIDLTAPAAYDDATAATYREVTTEAAYVVISHGPNGDGAWMPSGSQRTVGTASTAEQENTNDDEIFYANNYHSGFDDMVIYSTKFQVDYSTIDYDRWAVTAAECADISATLAAIGSASPASTEVAVMDGVTLDGGDATNIQIGRVLWYMQEICADYYPDDYSTPATDIKCPNNRTYDATATADNPEGSCLCGGVTTWNAGDQECS